MKYHVGCLTIPTDSAYPRIRFVTDVVNGVPQFTPNTQAKLFTSSEANTLMKELLANNWLAVTIRAPNDYLFLCQNYICKEETKCTSHVMESTTNTP